ncbi:ATP-binding protein [Streptosporangium saharense]|uniref:ATP-binding protein n=1 Tax=Streptosporangium saharense TaxID=1706840 RepID=UPI0036A9B652
MIEVVEELPLLHIDGATEGTTQWKAETLQLVNWGGFHGHHRLAFDAVATLIAGPSGSGKSTLLDAYLALMMPANVPFNAASNDATTGRARSADQRNLLTYLRGKTDTTRLAGTGELRDQVLRGQDSPTWGAIAMTFVDDNKRRYTVLRAYYVPRSATGTGDVQMKMAAKDAFFDLRELAPLAEKPSGEARFDRRQLKALGLTPFGGYPELEETLSARLGIGAGGEGAKALRLLARIQNGQQVRTVDDLYKSMVLERPRTYEVADRAVKHFADLEEAYQAMVTDADKKRVLEPLVIRHRDLEEATVAAASIDALGPDRTGDTPFQLWRLTTERDLLRSAIEANREARKTVHDAYCGAVSAEGALKVKVEEVEQQIRDNGGDALALLEAEIARLSLDRDRTEGERARFDERIAALSVAVASHTDFLALRSQAGPFLDSFEEAEHDLDKERTKLQATMYPLEERVRLLREEHESLSKRDGLIPPHLHNARLAIAQAANMTPEELPFAAELMDLADDQERWRTAAEVTLGSVARVMLVDADLLDDLSHAIDPLRLLVRINFEGVPLHPHQDIAADPARISGRLIFKKSPFSLWLQERVQAPQIDALCVENPEDLRGDGRRVTVNGQTRHGTRGAHGNAHERSIIGFSNRARRADIEKEVDGLKRTLTTLTLQTAAIGDRRKELLRRRDAHQYILDTDWSAIDVDGLNDQITTKEAEHQRILLGNDVLSELKARREFLEKHLEKERKTKFTAGQKVTALDDEHAQLDTSLTDVTEHLKRDHLGASLTPEHQVRLDAELAGVADLGDHTRFADGVERLRTVLLRRRKDEQDKARAATDALEHLFREFNSRWPDPNRGETMLSYPAYRDILHDIESNGLHQRQQEWKRRLSQWSGEDLVPLSGAFDTCVEEIEERLDPVNAILGTLPFGPGRDRLQIKLRYLRIEQVARFRKELKLLSSGVTENLTDAQAESRFARLRAFMGQIREPEKGSKTSSPRDRLLDVRGHVEITAVRESADGIEICTYSALGGKSGGENQELVAFIVGAALRFQLGDDSRTRPRFAPVVLDEGFVKSDSEFAGRAVSAWKGLGFQLIIGAPLDKVTALEPHMNLLVIMSKSHETGYSHVTTITGAER